MHLTIFDLDNTLLKVNSSFRYYFFLQRYNFFSLRSFASLFFYLIKYTYFNLSPNDLHYEVFKYFLKDRNYDELSKYVDVFFEKYLDKFFYMPALKRFQSAIANNHYTVILSNAPEFLVKPIAEILKVNEYQSSQYALDEKNNMVKIKKVMDGPAKAAYAAYLQKKLNVKRENITAYSDSIWDLPLLLYANKVTVVNPCKKLLAVSKTKKWDVI